MQIDILDSDRLYGQALAAALQRAFPAADIQAFVTADDAVFKAHEELSARLLLYTPEHFPAFTPRTAHLCLHDELPFAAASQTDSGRLCRLGSLKAILRAAEAETVKFRPPAPAAEALSCFFLPFLYPAARRRLKQELLLNQKLGKRSFLIEAGPSYFFSESRAASGPVYSADELLLALSLRKIRPEEAGKYWETWPELAGVQRLSLPKHPDDWLLSSPDLFRRCLRFLLDRSDGGTPDRRLFVLCCGLPLRLVETAAAMCDCLYLPSPDSLALNTQWTAACERLCALLPSGACCRYIEQTETAPSEDLAETGAQPQAAVPVSY